MKIENLLKNDAMIFDLNAHSKNEALDQMIENLYRLGYIDDLEAFKAEILKRESLSSTGIGDGIAIPHAKSRAVKTPMVLFAKSEKGIEFEAIDDAPVHYFFMIAAPEGADNTHLQTLAALSKKLMHAKTLDALASATNAAQVHEAFKDEEKAPEQTALESKDRPLIVAVTACPTGIAHTFMAEEALISKGKALGIDVRVETNGAEGVKNPLTADEIKRAIGVIVAADKKIEMARFDGKPLLKRSVKEGVHHAQKLIEEVIQGNASVYHADRSASDNEPAKNNKGWAAQFYTHLMSGVSNMLPFVIGGGILIAVSFLIDHFLGVPVEHLNQLGSYHESAKWFMTIGGAAFKFMLPVFAGFIAYSIADKPGLVAGFVAGGLAEITGAGFLGALVGGFLAGFVLILLKHLLTKLPQTLNGIKSILLYPVLGVLLTGALMLLLAAPMEAINSGLNHYLESLSGTNAIILGTILGAMMGADLGGPINKAAYVFGVGSLAATVATGGSVVMACVMAGGMVPPLATFVATQLFRHKFNKTDKDAGFTNLIMGASFITEGAIPFAAADPIRMIPSFILGSAITGALVGYFEIKLMAPHGGIFVILLVSKPWLYLCSIAIGAIISGIVIGLWKRAVELEVA